MPSTLVLNADRNVRPALGTWIDNNTDVLLGFSLRIAEDVLAQLQLQGKATSLNIQPTLAIEKGGDILVANMDCADSVGKVQSEWKRISMEPKITSPQATFSSAANRTKPTVAMLTAA